MGQDGADFTFETFSKLRFNGFLVMLYSVQRVEKFHDSTSSLFTICHQLSLLFTTISRPKVTENHYA